MSRGLVSALRIAAAVVALAAAALLAVGAEDARRWPERLRLDDLRFRADPINGGDWRESRWAGAAAVRSVLGIRDDLEFRRAVATFHAERQGPSQGGDSLGRLQQRAQLESLLRSIERDDPERQRRARAANMLGVLSFDAAIASRTAETALLDQTLDEFRSAVRVDPREEEAKYNLELLLHILARGDLRSSAGRGGTGGPESEAGGAGTTDPGRGY